MREATKTPTSLKDLRASVAQMREAVHAATIAQVLHKPKLCWRVAKKRPLLKKDHMKSHLEFAQRHVGDFKVNWKKVLWSDEKKLSFVAKTKHCASPQTHHLHHEAWWWQCHALGMLLKVERNMNGKKNIAKSRRII